MGMLDRDTDTAETLHVEILLTHGKNQDWEAKGISCRGHEELEVYRLIMSIDATWCPRMTRDLGNDLLKKILGQPSLASSQREDNSTAGTLL